MSGATRIISLCMVLIAARLDVALTGEWCHTGGTKYHIEYCDTGCCGEHVYDKYCCVDGDNDVSVGAIVGGVIGGLILLAVIVVVICVICYKQKRHRRLIDVQSAGGTVPIVITHQGYSKPPLQYPNGQPCQGYSEKTTQPPLYSGNGFTLNTAVKRSQPGLGSPSKLWWAKEITPDFHVAGRLTTRQIKYTFEAGFKSIFSLFVYEDNDAGNFGGEYLPTTKDASELAKSLGLGYASLIDRKGPWWAVETIQAFEEAIVHVSLPRPILLHCNRGFAITFVTLMHMANKTRLDSGFEPKINSENFYRIVAAMGLDFTAEHTKATVSNITGEAIVEDPPKPDCEPKNWLDFWLAHPIANNWYSAGQIRRYDLKVLEKTGFKAVVNLRMGVTFDGRPSQEKVTLLNINDNTSTYGSDLDPPRQSITMLKKSIINPEHGPDYIGSDYCINHEKANPEEFGDHIGYNEDMERELFKHHTVAYYHLPFNYFDEYSADLFNSIKKWLLDAGKKGPVLLHCMVGQRTAYIGVLAVAVQESYGIEWALRRLQELGYEASSKVRPDVYQMYRDVLEPRNNNKNEL